MEQTVSHTSLLRRPPPILAASASSIICLLSVFLWPKVVARELPTLQRAGHYLLPNARPGMIYEGVIWFSYLVIVIILTAIIQRSRMDVRTRWMCFTFFALVTTSGLARLINGGLFSPAPHWGMHDLGILAVFSSISSAMAITWVTIAHKMGRAPTAEYFANTTLRDAVTELPTLHGIQRQLGHDILKFPSRSFAVLLLDLDQFRRVNQTLGHHAGDELMAQVAVRLRRSIPRSNMIARIGADEFAIYLRHAHTGNEALDIAKNVQELLAGIIRVNEHEIAVTASIGISIYPDSGLSAAALLRNAETAMYQAQRFGNNHIELFTREMAALAEKKVTMESALRHAIERHEFSLQYQPQISLATGTVTGIEALLRWNSRDLGPVSPVEFLPLAEEIHLITPITNWVVGEACRFAVAFNAGRATPVTMAVNFSPSQLQRDDLADVVARALAASGLPGHLLEAEITENALMDDFPKTMRTLDSIRALGVGVSIDDFGTGFSSMSYILRFNIDRLKIDRSFIRDSSTSAQSAIVTVSIISLAHGLGIKVIAEGVETIDQVNMLAEAGCDDVQGYYFSRPVSPENLHATLDALEMPAQRDKLRSMMTRND